MYKNNRTILINYANDAYAKAQHFNSWTGKKIGLFDKVIEYHPEDIDVSFYNSHKEILEKPRGAGLWLWKPYFILKTLDQVNIGDYIFYCDSAAYFIRPCKKILDSMKNSDIWVSDIPLIEKNWSKKSMLEGMGVQANKNIIESNQIQGTFICVKKTDRAICFIKRWLEYCCNYELICPDSLYVDTGDCIAHREDQSILSVLCKLEGITAHRDPSQYGRIPEKYMRENAMFSIPNHIEDEYPVIIVLHRSREVNKTVAFRQWLNAVLPKRLIYALR
ncbi:MAG: hypothetical protein IJI01_01695 [Butyrivibrio sp.]|uniref:hypothetical protein n=1 Tax=Butyrivibrio sp. TaxID=28121 RepID=UPI0025C25E9C|nr:hypothetical protein [Butyrivibrio sp.]MBQ6587374.1 hypothetical protein [Butyrivibrio sp.]